MGMDLFGSHIDPATHEQYYFRASIWCWRPIAEVIRVTCGDLLSADDLRELVYNDCHRIESKKALAIGYRILRKLERGERIDIVSLGPDYPLDLSLLRDFCHFAIHSGGFTIC